MTGELPYLSREWPQLVMLPGRARQLVEDLVWIDKDREARAKQGLICDLASVPKALWWWISPDGWYRPAVVIHDRDYQLQDVSRRVADRTMLRIMLYVDPKRVPKAYVMWLGVRCFGWWAWRRNKRKLKAAKEA